MSEHNTEWRELNPDEQGIQFSEMPAVPGLQMLSITGHWVGDVAGDGIYGDVQYRTKLTPAELRKARGLEEKPLSFMPSGCICGVDAHFIYTNENCPVHSRKYNPQTRKEEPVQSLIAYPTVKNPDSTSNPEERPIFRNFLGRLVREAWVKWALTQPNPKPSWLAPWEQLSEPDKEADRQIGEAIHGAAASELASLREEKLNLKISYNDLKGGFDELREEVARLKAEMEYARTKGKEFIENNRQERDKLRAENEEEKCQHAISRGMLHDVMSEREQMRSENARLSQAVETMRAALEKGRTLIMRHHDSSFRIEAGCFCQVCSPDGKDGPYNEVFDALAAAPETGWVSREEYDKLKENADFLRASVGEAHLMISRNDYTIQMNDRKWEDTTLPARMVNYVGKELTSLRAKLAAAEANLRAMRAIAKDFQSQRDQWKARARTAEEWGKKFSQERDAARIEADRLRFLIQELGRQVNLPKP